MISQVLTSDASSKHDINSGDIKEKKTICCRARGKGGSSPRPFCRFKDKLKGATENTLACLTFHYSGNKIRIKRGTAQRTKLLPLFGFTCLLYRLSLSHGFETWGSYFLFVAILPSVKKAHYVYNQTNDSDYYHYLFIKTHSCPPY